MKRTDNTSIASIVTTDDTEFPQCVFCEHTYLSYCCQECPSREEPMPEHPSECKHCKLQKLADAFIQAFNFCVSRPDFLHEALIVDLRRFEDQTDVSFFHQYVYVVLNAGMKNWIAEGIYDRCVNDGCFESGRFNCVRHVSKRRAIEFVFTRYRRVFQKLTEANDKLAYLTTLPWIGDITKFHLARNLGLDYAKPDRHMVRLAVQFGYLSSFKELATASSRLFGCSSSNELVTAVALLCQDVAKMFGMRVGTVDLILWRWLSSGGAP